MAGFSVPQYQFVYQGEPAASGTVYVYQTGTVTLVTIYADGALTTPVSNPLTLDSNGEAKFYTDGSVNLRFDAYTSTGSFIQSIDPVYPVGGSASLPGNNTITNAMLAQANALTLKGNNTNSLANEQDLTVSQVNAMLGISTAGGFINKLRNGNFFIAQRGASGTVTTSGGYTVDGWIITPTGASVSWIALGNQGNFAEGGLQITGASGVTDLKLSQRIEGHIVADMFANAPLAGVPNITFQIQIANSTGVNLTPRLTVSYATALDNWGSSTVDLNAVNMQTVPNTNTATLAYTWTPGNGGYTNGIQISIDFGNNFGSGSNVIQLRAADLRATPGMAIGINNNPPAPEMRPIPIELEFCQRYLQIYNASSGSSIPIASGQVLGSTTAQIIIQNVVSPRIPFTGITTSTVGNFSVNSGSNTLTALAFTASSPYATSLLGTFASGGVAGNATYLLSTNASAQIVFTGAEL